MEIVNPAQAAVCCVFDSDDCHGEYLNMDSQGTSIIYHADCVGRENCVGFARQASTMDIKYLTCSPSFTYPDQTNYMFMDYFCISGARVGTMSSANIQSSTDMIYLRGQDYTTSGIAVTSASCSVESDDCNVIISVYALDLRLANDSTGACTQELSLSGTVFDCSDDNNFKINEIFQSSNNYINVNLSSTVTNEGYFWIGFNS
ncbi:hypothetical protein FSP39_004627 [Pinctada imbricata]|uniref:DOMON domain-containing protein n=1 Tax=Pinctada imbricata TaxID=66713 RepID=A0AA89C0S1_PINIB|nr:hypothetical protein FSP39_004627 [Pinctada imbricata]